MLLGVSIVLTTPAHACGCGAYIPMDSSAGVVQERVMIRFDGSTEEITMGLSVEGRSKEAAWILPVSHRASLRLGDHRLSRSWTRYTLSRDDTLAGAPLLRLTASSAATAVASTAAVPSEAAEDPAA